MAKQIAYGEEARKAVEVILAIYRSSETGAPVKLPL
jgi:predicted dehydrogenase